jgi:hypothetical protein
MPNAALKATRPMTTKCVKARFKEREVVTRRDGRRESGNTKDSWCCVCWQCPIPPKPPSRRGGSETGS